MTEMSTPLEPKHNNLLESARHLSHNSWTRLSERIKAVDPLAVGGTLISGAVGLAYTVGTLHGFHEAGQIMHLESSSILQGAKDYFDVIKNFIPQSLRDTRIIASSYLAPALATLFDTSTAIIGGKTIIDFIRKKEGPTVK